MEGLRVRGCGALVSLGLLLAGPAVAQTLFTEVTTEALGALPFPKEGFSWEGIAWGDYDNDGWPDMFAVEDYRGKRIALLHNEAGKRFTDHTPLIEAEKPSVPAGLCGVFGDYDNDGDLDLYVPFGHVGPNWKAPDLLLRNERGTLRDVAGEAGLRQVQNSTSALWLDFDRDGYLDLFVHRMTCCTELDDPGSRNSLFRNQGDGTFVDIAEEVGLAQQFSPWGGSGGAFSDFNNDGWIDVYILAYLAPGRLFFNNSQGVLEEATTSEVAVEGEKANPALGDIDNDGDVDIYVTAGGAPQNGLLYRSYMLLNLGNGTFLDVTEGIGIGGDLLASNALGAVLEDLDNDGHLDLLTATPHKLYLNRGDGTLEDHTASSGMRDVGGSLNAVDFNLDGFLDVQFGSNEDFFTPGRLYVNKGNDNHYLRVELAGVKSTRNGVGARLSAQSGDLHQTREVYGGTGFYQDEMVAHFGLGIQTRVDTLEIRWPSGQVDVLTDIPADQKIRVIEGSNRYHRVEPTRWQQAPPETLVAGTTPQLNLAIQTALFDPEARITRVTADLSALGGDAEVVMTAEADGTWVLETALKVEGPNGFRNISVMIDQSTSLGPYWTQLSRQVTVIPGGDLVIFDEALAPGWQVENSRRIKSLDLSEAGVVHQGRLAGAFEGDGGLWTVTFKPPAPVDPVGYIALGFAFHPGEVVPSSAARFTVTLNPSKALSLLDSGWVELNKKAWQVVEIPMEAFARTGPLASLFFTGNLQGTFYLDDLRLVAATPPPVTVVEEERTAVLPQSFSLSQNFPNPFNSETVIRFALPESEEVELAVYNLAGQQVVKLVAGVREAGSYTVRWDGRDEQGHELASGVYVYRLRAGKKMETHRLVLVR